VFIIATANIRETDGKGTIECDIHPLAISIQHKQNEMVERSKSNIIGLFAFSIFFCRNEYV